MAIWKSATCGEAHYEVVEVAQGQGGKGQSEASRDTEPATCLCNQQELVSHYIQMVLESHVIFFF